MIRRTLATVTLALGFLAVLPGTPAQARACQIDFHCVTTYYSDLAQTTMVGQMFEDCVGDISSWGTRTGYYTWVETPC